MYRLYAAPFVSCFVHTLRLAGITFSNNWSFGTVIDLLALAVFLNFSASLPRILLYKWLLQNYIPLNFLMSLIIKSLIKISFVLKYKIFYKFLNMFIILILFSNISFINTSNLIEFHKYMDVRQCSLFWELSYVWCAQLQKRSKVRLHEFLVGLMVVLEGV